MSSEIGKQRLIPWLRARIDSGDIKGLEWLDDTHTEFRIPWKHGGKQSFDSEEDSRIFREWALHTGKYSEATDRVDPTKWKQNLRCAFNKSKEIAEEKDKHCLEGSDPYKVYRIKARANKRLVGNRSSPPRVEEADSTSPSPQDSPDASDLETLNLANEQADTNLPSFDQLMHASGGKSGTDSYSDPMELEKRIVSGDLVLDTPPTGEISITSLPSLSDILPGQQVEFTVVQEEDVMEGQEYTLLMNVDAGLQQREEQLNPASITILPPVSPNVQIAMLPPSPHPAEGRVLPAILRRSNPPSPSAAEVNTYPEMLLRVRYLGEVMLRQTMCHPGGCRLRASRAPRQDFPLHLDEKEQLLGSSDARPIELPPFSLPPGKTYGQNARAAARTRKDGEAILEAMYRGVELHTDDGNLYVRRLCKCKIFLETPDKTLEQVARYEDSGAGLSLKIFDYRNQYAPQLDEFQRKRTVDADAARPNPFVHLVFGQKKCSGDAIVCVSVASKFAFDQLQQVDPGAREEDWDAEMESALMFSKTDEFDDRAQILRTVEEWTQAQSQSVQTGQFYPHSAEGTPVPVQMEGLLGQMEEAPVQMGEVQGVVPECMEEGMDMG